MDVKSRYSVPKPLGRSGSVYLTIDRISLQKRVLKVLDLSSYHKELYFLRKLQNGKNAVPKLLDAWEFDTRGVLVMSYEEGVTLEDAIRSKDMLDEKIVRRVMAQLCEIMKGLEALRPAVLHLDLKPSNLILRADGTLCLLDFGSAGEYWPDGVSDDRRSGTYGYLSPEQLDGRTPDRRDDLYGIGQILKRMLYGYRTDHRRRQYSRTLYKIAKKATLPVHRRYQSIEELEKDLCKFADRQAAVKRFKGPQLWKQILVSGWIAICVIYLLLHLWYPDSRNTLPGDEEKQQIREAVFQAGESMFRKLKYIEILQAEEDFAVAEDELKELLRKQEMELLQKMEPQKERELYRDMDSEHMTVEAALEADVQILEDIIELCELYNRRSEELGNYAKERVLTLCEFGIQQIDLYCETGEVERTALKDQEMFFLETILEVLDSRSAAEEVPTSADKKEGGRDRMHMEQVYRERLEEMGREE